MKKKKKITDNRSKLEMYMSDFETTSTEVVQWGTKKIFKKDNKMTYGVDMEGWLKDLKLKGEQTKTVKVFFHNLGGFDGYYIIPFLLREEFIDKKNKKKEDRTNIYDLIIDDTGNIICINLKFREWNEKRTKKITIKIQILDSLKYFPMSAAIIGKSVGLPKLDPENNYNYEYRKIEDIPEVEWVYLERDLDIIIKMFLSFHLIIPYWKWKLTLSQTVFDYWLKDKRRKEWTWNMEEENNKEIWYHIKNWYRGGIVYVKPEEEFKVHKKVYRRDVNSLYPSVMYNWTLPMGPPIPLTEVSEGDDTYELYSVLPIEELTLKEGMMPFIPTKGMFGGAYIYGKTLKKWKTIYLTGEELDIFHKTYQGEYDVELEYCFESVNGNFKQYIDTLMGFKLKGESTGNMALRSCAKLCMNSLYGKFGQKIDRVSKELIEIPEGEDITKLHKSFNGTHTFQNVESTSKYSKYIPMAIAITSGSRMTLLDAINKNFNHFIYCDTDSIHTKKKPIKLNEDNTLLGAWKDEGIATDAIYRIAKQYTYMENGKRTIKIAGFPAMSKNKYGEFLTNDMFINGVEMIQGKLITRKINDGVVFSTMDYKLIGKNGKIKWTINENMEISEKQKQ